MSERVVKLPEFRGGNLDFLRNHDHEVVLTGGADCGKTWAGCIKSFLLCADVHRKNVHGCMVRKTFNSIESSCGRTFKTLTQGMNIRRVGGVVYTDKWIFPNGSELVPVGLDKPEKLLSSEWDFAQIVQAEQLSESDWELVASRCTGRGAVVAYPQVFGDSNPSGLRHWIPLRAKAGKLTRLWSVHKDNPALFDAAGNITPEGIKRLGFLETTLTGVRRERLLHGRDATAEGAIYEQYNPAIHAVHRDDAEFQYWYITMDEGYTNPCAILLVGVDSDGRWHVLREWYETRRRESECVRQAKEWYDEMRCQFAAVDEAAAGLIAEMNNQGLYALAGKGGILNGIKKIQDKLAIQGDGRPRLTHDPACVNLQNEFESYVWKKEVAGINKEVPLDKDNHALGALRYLRDVLEGDAEDASVAYAEQVAGREDSFASDEPDDNMFVDSD